MAIIILFIIAPVLKHLKVDVEYNRQKVMYLYNGILYGNEKNYSYMQQHVLISQE